MRFGFGAVQMLKGPPRFLERILVVKFYPYFFPVLSWIDRGWRANEENMMNDVTHALVSLVVYCLHTFILRRRLSLIMKIILLAAVLLNLWMEGAEVC